jgi:hypothetical protein
MVFRVLPVFRKPITERARSAAGFPSIKLFFTFIEADNRLVSRLRRQRT